MMPVFPSWQQGAWAALDILLVALLIYQVLMMIRGTLKERRSTVGSITAGGVVEPSASGDGSTGAGAASWCR